MATSIAGTPYLWRLAGAVVLDGGAYEEIEMDRSATPHAFVTVAIAGLAAGVGLGSGSLGSIALITI